MCGKSEAAGSSRVVGGEGVQERHKVLLWLLHQVVVRENLRVHEQGWGRVGEAVIQGNGGGRGHQS